MTADIMSKTTPEEARALADKHGVLLLPYQLDRLERLAALIDEVRRVDAESPLSDVRAILYQCDRGNVSLSWLIDALRGIVERAESAPSQPAAPVELPVVAWRREWEGDDSDLCHWLYADEYEPKDDNPNWDSLVRLSDAQAAIAAGREVP